MIWKNENLYDGLIEYWAQGVGVPRNILKGLIAKESSFNPKAYKSEPQINDASRGLAQLLASTAEWVGVLPKGGDVNLLYDPARSIQGGALTLRRYWEWAQKYGGGWEDALSIYNGGSVKGSPGKARRNADGTYKNQSYVDDVKVYSAYFAGQVTEADTRSYQKTKVLSVAIPALGVLLAVGLGFLLLRHFSA